MSVVIVVFFGRGLYDGLITPPGSSTQCGVCECDHESTTRRPWPTRAVAQW